jgi:hypothetical protein
MSQNVSQCLTPTDADAAPNPVSEPPELISDRQRVALDMIASGATDTAAASAIGVHRRTIYRWRVEDARFREELERRRRELYERVQDRFRTMLGAALDVLDKQIKDAYVPTARSAARTLLALAAIGKALKDAGARG